MARGKFQKQYNLKNNRIIDPDQHTYARCVDAQYILSRFCSKEMIRESILPEQKLLVAVLCNALLDWDTHIKLKIKAQSIAIPKKDKKFLREWFENGNIGTISLKFILNNISDLPEQAHQQLIDYINDHTKAYFVSSYFSRKKYQ